jgi:hypothetical protein
VRTDAELLELGRRCAYEALVRLHESSLGSELGTLVGIFVLAAVSDEERERAADLLEPGEVGRLLAHALRRLADDVEALAEAAT